MLSDYYKFTGPARMRKTLESLVGLIEGIDIDRTISDDETAFLIEWLNSHTELIDRHPFCELVPVLQHALGDNRLTRDEKDDVLWLAERLLEETTPGRVSEDMLRLHAILGGIVADRSIEVAELAGLRSWLMEHEALRTVWPYDEVDSLLTNVLADGVVSGEEHATLMAFFSQFVHVADDRVIVQADAAHLSPISGICAVDPPIAFDGRHFTFTGESGRYRRSELVAMVTDRGGFHAPSVCKRTDYLVVGSEGNPCWAYACYGRKVEQAVIFRKKGSSILIVHEIDLLDSMIE